MNSTTNHHCRGEVVDASFDQSKCHVVDKRHSLQCIKRITYIASSFHSKNKKTKEKRKIFLVISVGAVGHVRMLLILDVRGVRRFPVLITTIIIEAKQIIQQLLVQCNFERQLDKAQQQ